MYISDSQSLVYLVTMPIVAPLVYQILWRIVEVQIAVRLTLGSPSIDTIADRQYVSQFHGGFIALAYVNGNLYRFIGEVDVCFCTESLAAISLVIGEA